MIHGQRRTAFVAATTTVRAEWRTMPLQHARVRTRDIVQQQRRSTPRVGGERAKEPAGPEVRGVPPLKKGI